MTENLNAKDWIGHTLIFWAAFTRQTEIVKILAPLTYNPNAPLTTVIPAIQYAAMHGNTEIVKNLAPLTTNPNAPDIDGDTPIYMAAEFGGNLDVKFLAPLTDNPNAPNKDGETPSSVTNNAEMKRFLETFNTSKNPLVGSTTMSPNKGKKS